jgi:hypothetical protein
MFNDLVINRTDSSNNLTQIINVPIEYAQKEKMLTRVISDPAIERTDAIILPTISFEIVDIVYDSNRKINTIGRYFANSSNTSVDFYYNPVPYDIHFNLYIYVKNNEDATKIIEQIVPFFTPDFTVKANMFNEIPTIDVPIILDGVKIDDTNDQNFKERTVIIWNLGFTLKGNFYGPKKTSSVINVANIVFSTWDGGTANLEFQEFGVSANLSSGNNIVTGLEFEYFTVNSNT